MLRLMDNVIYGVIMEKKTKKQTLLKDLKKNIN